MKKKNMLMFLSLLLTITLITTGCGKEIEIKNGAKVAVSTNNDKFTATEYYNEIKKDNISKLVDMIDHKLLDKKYPSTDEEKNNTGTSFRADSSFNFCFRASDGGICIMGDTDLWRERETI